MCTRGTQETAVKAERGEATAVNSQDGKYNSKYPFLFENHVFEF